MSQVSTLGRSLTAATIAGTWLAVIVLGSAAPSIAQPRSAESPAPTAAKRPIAHEDVWLMRRVGAPAASPDGRWVAFSVTEPAYEESDQWSDLWVAPVDGSAPPRRLTTTRRGESGPAWSPDSRRLAFSTKREDDETDQIYVIDVVAGGEASRVTDVATGARDPKWRPDGAALLFTSDVWVGAKDDAENRRIIAERKARKHNARVYEIFPIRHWDRWLDERRPSLLVQPLEPGAQPRDLLAGSKLVAERGYGGRLANEGDQLDAVWTPDGTGVVFAATIGRDASARASIVNSLWLVPASGGEPRRLTSDRASYSAPVFSRAGRSLFAAHETVGERIYTLKRIARFSWPEAGAPQIVSAKLDRSIENFGVSPDGALVYASAEDAGKERIYAIGVRDGSVREIGALEAGCFSALAVGGDSAPALVARYESAVRPPEVVRIDAVSGQRTPLTSFNVERAAAIDWEPLQEFWFTSSRGRRIHNLVALPPGFDRSKKYPLFVVIHGGPHTMWRDQFVIRWNYHLLAAPGYVVLLTNYTGSTGFGEAFAQGIQGDPLRGPGRELNEAADAAIARYSFIDGSRQVAGGASYGGHLANWLAVTTTRYRALVSHAGLFDLKTQWSTSDLVYDRERTLAGPFWEGGVAWREQSPLYRAASLRTPMLLTIGERDYRVPMNNTLELWTVLQRQNVPSRLVIFPEENHWILKGENSRFFYAEVHEWLARHLAAPVRSAQAAEDPS
jgi:dipeptidyl aminopeptidase/acylaminoacyl peptidase